MKNKKQLRRLNKIPATTAKQEIAAVTQESSDVMTKHLFKSGRSLLNKYNQKRPAGSKKLSPAADEEME